MSGDEKVRAIRLVLFQDWEENLSIAMERRIHLRREEPCFKVEGEEPGKGQEGGKV